MVELRRESKDTELTTQYVTEMTMASLAPSLAKFRIDQSFEAVSLASDYKPSAIAGFAEAFGIDDSAIGDDTYVIRGEIDDGDLPNINALDIGQPVVGVYSDPPISAFITCGGSPPLGTDADVERLLCVPKLSAKGLNGSGVYVAVVDTGINMQYLNSRGKHPAFDAIHSWVPRAGLIPGSLPVGHGTMCAFDVCIAAPKCTLLDIAVLQSTAPGGSVMDGLLSDAVRAYAHLRAFWRSLANRKALVVTNSWGMFHPNWDFPVGHPGNYSNNANHPFNRIVGTLEREGADILFAAGNCGNECPDGRCSGVVNAIYGANSHRAVMSVAGVDTARNRVGYSTKGPGRLAPNKPDISGYTHFKGSGVYPADSGTSAATPVVAGVVAAVRTRKAYRPLIPTTWPRAIRTLLFRTAIDKGAPGYDLEYGWGVVDGCKLSSVVFDTASGKESTKNMDGAEDAKTRDDVVPSSGPAGEDLDGSNSTPITPQAIAGPTGNLFFRLSRDSAPGRNIHTISGLPSGTKTISIWVTEWVQPNNSHAGGAIFSTSSVQLFENGTKCRFIFDMNWGSHLPTGVQLIFGS